MRLIDADKLPKIDTGLCDAFGNMYGADTVVIWSDIENAPTIDAVEIKTLEAWLDKIAMNNINNYLSDACEEIISRLDGLRVFAKELRSHQNILCDQTEEGEA